VDAENRNRGYRYIIQRIGLILIGTAIAVGMPLILGTWWTFIPAGAVILLFIIRTAFEDRTLPAELEGYEAYTRKTRYRLFPGVW
jgi:protein-S-isoprenylcysteine O-methyltransferase Ste14